MNFRTHDRLRQRHALVMTEQFRSDFVEWVKKHHRDELSNIAGDLERCFKGHRHGKELYFFSRHMDYGSGYWVGHILAFAEDMRRRMKQDRYADFLLKSVSFTKEDNVRATVFGTMPNDTFDVTLQLNVTYKVPEEAAV